MTDAAVGQPDMLGFAAWGCHVFSPRSQRLDYDYLAV